MSLSKEKVRFGIVGCGTVSPLHAESMAACPYTELVAVSDVQAGRATEFAAEHGVKHTFTDYRELLQSGLVDAVSVCTPSGLHGEVAIAAAQAGRHVLCEKPLEIRAETLTAMIAAADKGQIKLGAVYQRRGLALTQRIKSAIDAGVLGPLVLCDAYLKYYRGQAYYDSAGWRGTYAMDGGGALMNQGVHGVDMIQWLGGGIRKVYARAAALARNIEVEDTAVAVVEFHSGAFGVIEGATTVYPERSTRFELHGERGTIVFDDQGLQQWQVRDVGDVTEAERGEPEQIAGIHSVGHYRFVEDMARAILEDREPLVPGREARKAVDIILAIYESARTGREVVLA
ncbi:MAG: Gfo/Idh/MocA family oxidoreductase [Firmicutes bacterium]|nr:Gfo/Idh/MocA family oxidoreductase [Bacillota bacterium]